jgi:CheY-like chemotaxis protein
MRILYVEDNPANLFLVKRVAKMGGHEVINYIDGEDALTHFTKDKPDLVLMDIQLAGELSGLEVVRRLRASGHKTPIIAVTAYAMIGDRERFLAAGCDDYLAKPLPIPRLVELLEQYNSTLGKTTNGTPGEAVVEDAPTRKVPRPNVPEAFLHEILERSEKASRQDETPTVVARQVKTEDDQAAPMDDAPTLPTRTEPLDDEPDFKLETLEAFDEQDTQIMPPPPSSTGELNTK